MINHSPSTLPNSTFLSDSHSLSYQVSLQQLAGSNPPTPTPQAGKKATKPKNNNNNPIITPKIQNNPTPKISFNP